jgi:hypothetical protein
VGPDGTICHFPRYSVIANVFVTTTIEVNFDFSVIGFYNALPSKQFNYLRNSDELKVREEGDQMEPIVFRSSYLLYCIQQTHLHLHNVICVFCTLIVFKTVFILLYNRYYYFKIQTKINHFSTGYA